jgi:co-chaperonin GroES (HSP10)
MSQNNVRFIYKPDIEGSSAENVKIEWPSANGDDSYTTILVGETGSFALNSKTGETMPLDEYWKTLKTVECESCDNYSEEIKKMDEKKTFNDHWVVDMRKDTRKPGPSRLIVEILQEDHKTKSGLFIVAADETDYITTRIIAIGATKESYNVGDRCVIIKGAGMDIGMSELAILEGDILFTEPM